MGLMGPLFRRCIYSTISNNQDDGIIKTVCKIRLSPKNKTDAIIKTVCKIRLSPKNKTDAIIKTVCKIRLIITML